MQLINEDIMRDIHHADSEWKIILLRYFNPVGCHPSGEIGEDPVGFPNNLMPFVQQVAVGRRESLTVFGHDYDTRDGTGVSILNFDFFHLIHNQRMTFPVLIYCPTFSHNKVAPRCNCILNTGTVFWRCRSEITFMSWIWQSAIPRL